MKNRLIKFRCWSFGNNKMYEVEKYNPPNVTIVRKEDPAPILGLENVYLMQSTGLLDQDKKEIYEGDIISFAGLETKFKVIFDEDSARFRAEPDNLNFTREGMASFAKVIGNVYKDGELINNEIENE